jgi:putative transposase
VEYIDGHAGRFGVAPICRVLSAHGIPIAPSTYYDARRRESAPSPARLRDAELCEHIARVHAENFGVYGARKVWLQLNREGITVARCTVERLMKALGLQGVRRGKVKRTTIADPAAARANDLVGRRFGPLAPNVLWVADITYVSTWSGWVYVAFVTDAYARRILGWRTSTSMTTQLVLDAVEHAIWTRGRHGVADLGGVIHHTDAGSQGGFNWSSQHLDFVEVSDGVWEAAVGGSRLSGADPVAGAADGGLAGGPGQVLGGDRCRGDDRGCRCRGRRVVTGRVSLVPSCWRRESTDARICFGPLPVLE